MTNEELKAVKMAWARGEVVQYNQGNGWRDWKDTRCLKIDYASPYNQAVWRIKPKTIRIGDYDVPEPLRKMEIGQEYFAVGVNGVCQFSFLDNSSDKYWLKFGLCHATPEAAELHTKALLSFTEEK